MKTKTILIVAICVICAATMMSGCIGNDYSDPIGETRFGASDIAEDLNKPSYVEEPIKVGIYENPIPLGNILVSSTGALYMQIVFIERGEKVNILAQHENMFNGNPKIGNEYMLISMVVHYSKMDHLDADEKFSLSSRDFDAYANGIECDRPFLILPDPFDTSTSTYMMPGSTSSVYMIFEVPQNEKVIIAYDRLFVSDKYYFDTGTKSFVYETTPTKEIITTQESTLPLTSFQGMEILSKYDDDRDGILNNDERIEITDLFMRDMLTPPQREAYIAIWGYPITYRR